MKLHLLSVWCKSSGGIFETLQTGAYCHNRSFETVAQIWTGWSQGTSSVGKDGDCTNAPVVCWDFWDKVIIALRLWDFVNDEIYLALSCSIASRINWPIIGKRISREFDIPKNILDLVYLQAILWWASSVSHGLHALHRSVKRTTPSLFL